MTTDERIEEAWKEYWEANSEWVFSHNKGTFEAGFKAGIPIGRDEALRDLPPWFTRLREDMRNFDLAPEDSCDRLLKCEIKHGERVYWYFKEDAKYAKEFQNDVREQRLYSGILLHCDGQIADGREIDIEDCVLVVDHYPTEKCWPDVSWIALGRLLASEGLVEVYSLPSPSEVFGGGE